MTPRGSKWWTEWFPSTCFACSSYRFFSDLRPLFSESWSPVLPPCSSFLKHRRSRWISRKSTFARIDHIFFARAALAWRSRVICLKLIKSTLAEVQKTRELKRQKTGGKQKRGETEIERELERQKRGKRGGGEVCDMLLNKPIVH